ncbi:ceramide kinase [Marchantia polymorpha subsp. ruderalis]|nr:hypothetical protein MARPO_0032s0128 [Marchantia polymorpha]BBN11743.1 hypothetical protein Mp_5g14360 [Marchantia polymorpha subsp. ruderalis]|eukprot:PTQ41963.1 hypothetical protein MARPO_0032s0128 [Marchantia polymorpha]
MGETFERIPLEAEGENYGEDPSSPGKLRKVIPLQNFLKNSEGSGNLEVVMEQELYLEKFGYVNVVLVRDCLSWQLVDSDDLIGTSCWGGRKDLEKSRDQVLVSEIFAVEYSGLSNPASIGMCGPFTNPLPQMHRFAVHTFLRAQSNKCNWTPKVHTFCHASAEICQSWVDRIQGLIDRDLSRPKNLLVLINPYGGKKAGVRQWETVAPLFHKAGVKTKVLLTERAQHAYDLMAQSTEEELKNLDGVIVVGGDGLFNEVLNGLVMHRHKGHPAPNPERVLDLMAKRWKTKKRNNSSSHLPSEEGLRALSNMERKNDQSSGPSFDVHSPLLTDSPLESRAVNSTFLPAASKDVVGSASTRDPGKLQYSGSNRHKTNAPLRIGIIPAGSTDTVAISTTGSRDPVTAALHVLLGDSMPLDIVKITGWKKTPQSVDEPPRVRYAASFAGYGFYGDVMRESENARWLGPARYDIAGVKVFLKHKTYQAEVSYLDIPQIPAGLKNLTPRNGSSENSKLTDRAHRVICRVNCGICAQGMDLNHLVDSDSEEEELEEASAELQATKPRWRSLRGSFHSVGGAVMSCRNDKAPDGLAAHAHLADGLLHLILIRKCSRPSYLRQLISLTRRGADPFNFDFVEHYKTPVFTFTSVGEESIWNIDGELFPAHQLTAQVARGLVNIYARGPED